jgi:hypothetical protein
MATEFEKAQASPVAEKADSAEIEDATNTIIDAETNRKLLKRIDRRVMPVVSPHHCLRN